MPLPWVQAVQILNTTISQGNVMTRLRCGEIFNDRFTANFLLSLPMNRHLGQAVILRFQFQDKHISQYSFSTLSLLASNRKDIWAVKTTCSKSQYHAWHETTTTTNNNNNNKSCSIIIRYIQLWFTSSQQRSKLKSLDRTDVCLEENVIGSTMFSDSRKHHPSHHHQQLSDTTSMRD